MRPPVATNNSFIRVCRIPRAGTGPGHGDHLHFCRAACSDARCHFVHLAVSQVVVSAAGQTVARQVLCGGGGSLESNCIYHIMQTKDQTVLLLLLSNVPAGVVNCRAWRRRFNLHVTMCSCIGFWRQIMTLRCCLTLIEPVPVKVSDGVSIGWSPALVSVSSKTIVYTYPSSPLMAER